ncbi:hypothetical protein [Streptomyces sp. TP-A0874]|uniref:hypothetical protein n=1 Tax=Streptomyces sp. TP-A0874 TaxID=549819 RepID=UPI000852E43E|nr:hypothetical protein [Streptomyces sp. TP-A0874]
MSTASQPRSLLKRALTGPGAVTRVATAAVLFGTLAAQHPNPGFNRVQRSDIFSALYPNWRFFAPTPAQHDYHFFYRTLDHSGETSKWRLVDVISGRKFRQIAWFPGRRPEKAVFDICSELITSIDKGFDEIVPLPAYRMLVNFLRREIGQAPGASGVKGFQFTLTRATGYDESNEPEIIFVSPYTPMAEDESVSRPRTRVTPATPDAVKTKS